MPKALAEYLSETSLQQLGVNVRVTHTQDPVPSQYYHTQYLKEFNLTNHISLTI
jgi:hypothetical protein